MKIRKLTAQQSVKLLAAFYDQSTVEDMQNSFGWEHAPQVPPGQVYAFDDIVETVDGDIKQSSRETIGFGIMELNTKDASDTEASLWAGVFPSFRRRGYWHKIMDWLVIRAGELGADYASRTVNKINEEHYNRSMREAHAPDSKWIYAGDHWWPMPGHGYFVYPLDDRKKAPK